MLNCPIGKGTAKSPSNLKLGSIEQATVVQALDSAIHRVKIYPMDSAIIALSIGFPNTYLLDSDLSGG